MATKLVQPAVARAKLTRTDKRDLLIYAAVAMLIAFLPNILACVGIVG